ncbi:hypothetical protein PRO82_000143 [Candidatus Protochlamydia amoebophila]|nr:hypothetical protein [Candidatus Protochlamydia amoebophila]
MFRLYFEGSLLKKGLFSVRRFCFLEQKLSKEAKMNEIEIIKLFCLVDDFSNRFHQMCFQKQIEYTKKNLQKRF